MSSNTLTYKIEDANLEFARKHIERFYASDFYPDVPEFEAVWAAWGEVKALLTSSPVAKLGDAPLLRAAPKSGGGYRVVHQLQPLDALLYTALAHRVAEAVEAKRHPKEAGVVCSYRLTLSDGGFFDEDHDGYKTFHDRSSELADQNEHVLSVDIASFYNHIYVHRLQNSLELCDRGLKEISRSIEEFLLNINHRQSVGIPIGPAASIVFAEALLIDVDEFLTSECSDVAYVRYVDDFRFFANSKAELVEVHHKLTSYLHKAHRLSLASGKSKLSDTGTFKDRVLAPPEDAERDALQDQLDELLDEIGANPYGGLAKEEASDLTWDDASTEARIETLQALFRKLTKRHTLDIGLARHLLRRSRRARIREILPMVIDNAGFLLPVFRDVGLYLRKVLSAGAIESHLAAFETLTEDEELTLPFATHWLRWLFASRSEFSKSSKIEAFVMGAPADVRARAEYARTNRRLSWVKNMKDDWRNLSPWDRRALILSGETLATAERNIWMDAINDKPPEPLDAFVARYVKSL